MRTRAYPWLLPAVLILFLTQVVLFPFAVGLTYAGRSESPHHVLTYTTGSLTWDSATGVDPDTGVAELSLFSDSYQNVQSDNGDKVVAPGTENTNIVRLKNDVSRTITYVAVMYRIKEEHTLPVEPALLENEAYTDTDTYPLPEGVTRDQVVRAVTGTVDGGQIQDFDIHWKWNYYDSDQRDQVDTALGNKAAWFEADEVTAGLYIVVMEDEDPGDPDPGDPDPDNPDPENPDLENPDPDNPDPENPDLENPDPENPDPENPDPENPDPENPDPDNPDTENPDPENPDPDNPDPENPDPENPNPDGPGDPNDPDGPDDPDNPDDPDDPDSPDDPDDPDGPDDPGAPHDPDDPGQPYTPPEVPKTGDNSHPILYMTLMAISGVVLVLLLWDRRREGKR